MTITEKIKNQKESRKRAQRVRTASRLCVLLAALTLSAMGSLNTLAFATAQAPEEGQAAPQPPANPTPEERRAALDQIGVQTSSEIPDPAADPAGAAAFNVKMNDALANPDPPAPEPSVAVKLAPDFDPKKSYSRLR